MKPTKLSPVQEKVMTWANGGWALSCRYGNAIFVNGQRVCNRDTIEALVRLGLLVAVGRWEWRAPEFVKKDDPGNVPGKGSENGEKR